MDSTQELIKNQVTANPVVLYMKGTPKFPQCGFSGLAVQILQASGVKDFVAVDVLADPAIRDGIKVYANWPTIPQLYIKGEFVGGADIMRDLFQQGELQKMLESATA
ncbi:MULTISPECIES: Grx4 family monothiol glutaredoxin [Methylovorus]|jgi:monothiol glutaredoxin|uniref:Glutaredoxin n=1 Tax=Methylovorus glucosotrophus (strain SIP3-4) TaxID=582744 RepID=C6X8P2_METGS|nr:MULTISPECIES: Grx4 family monothiol glutaredoxin [Methylovorus]ACT49512.1 glutaredoxin-like protein [Methylovorus glucosotrophus SIP3-4]ADQ83465.1 glutaredoxin-like protein [Methylovorus sp. MP688]KAF0836128.1 monothiol glutaredoxin [Methylovorus glucosotrophus]